MREAQNLLIAVGGRSNPRTRYFANSMLISIFFVFHLIELFLVVFSRMFAKLSFASVVK